MYGLDLFSGIGGLTNALEGYVHPLAFCENDRYAQAVLLSRMAERSLPYAPIWNDVCTLRGDMLPQPIDIIYGGFPCQDISAAGRGAGLAGKRSGLFFEIVRLASEIQPRFIFLENVPAIRSRGADVVVGEMARLGYDCRWLTLSAAEIGANHRRERWWLLAHSKRSEWRPETEGRHEPNGRDTGRKETASGTRERREDVAHASGARPGRIRSGDAARLSGAGSGCANVADAIINGRIGRFSRSSETQSRRPHAEIGRRGWWAVEPAVGRVVNGLPARVDRLRALGNAVVPAQAREAFQKLMGLKNA